MTKRTFISKSGDQYEWEETPEVLAALEHYINQNIRSSNSKFPNLDKSTPWYNFTLYMESCNSLGFKPSITSYVRYNTFYKSSFLEK
jgi:hypothetical protein